MESYSKVEKLIEILRILRLNITYFNAEPLANIPSNYQIRNLEISHLLHQLYKLRVNDLLTELNTNFLTATQKKYFFLIYGQKINEAQEHINYILSQPINTRNPALVLLINALKLIIDNAVEAVRYCEQLTQDSTTPVKHKDTTYGPHFHRRPLTPNEPARITSLLVAAHLIPDTTHPEDIQYVFYGLSTPVSAPVTITWLKTAAELSYFVETYFASSDPRNKWKTAAEVFIDTQNNHYNQKTLKQRLYNYTSKVKLSSFQVIDTLLLPLLQNPDK